MKARFEWLQKWSWDDDVLRPDCAFVGEPAGFKGCLQWVLTDHGGDPDFPYLEWAEEGLQKLESVRRGEVPEEDWSSNSWSCDITPHQVNCYFTFLDDSEIEKEGDVMSIKGVEAMLKAWITFLRKGPDLNRVEEIEVHLT